MICKVCGGTGSMNTDPVECYHCDGTGKEPEVEALPEITQKDKDLTNHIFNCMAMHGKVKDIYQIVVSSREMGERE